MPPSSYSGKKFTFWVLLTLCVVSAAAVAKLGSVIVENFRTHAEDDKLPIECVLVGLLVLVMLVALRGAYLAGRRR